MCLSRETWANGRIIRMSGEDRERKGKSRIERGMKGDFSLER